jgi:hypothetical protein
MIGTNLAITTKNYSVAGGAAIDTDAQAFITAAGITNATQQSAVNQLVLNLKSANIWTKMKAIYPIVGGTATTHKWNLKNPLDTNAAYRLTYTTGWTHSSTGMKPSSAYAETFLNGTVLGGTSIHTSTYTRTQATDTNHRIEIGAFDGTNFNASSAYYSTTGKFVTYGINNAANLATNATTNTLGFQIGSRTSATSLKLYWNGSLLSTNTNSSSNQTNQTFFLGGYKNNVGVGADFSNRELSFVSIGDGLTDTESSNFYTAVNNYQTTLGRNV